MRLSERLSFKSLALPGIVLLTFVFIVYAYRGWSRGDAVPQPISFNHRVHTVEAQLDCDQCHAYYSQGARSGLPDVESCMFCHEDAVGESAEEAKLRDRYQQGQPVVFRKLFHLQPDVYYSHRRHVVLAKIECAQCHGDIGDSTSPPLRPMVEISMDFCTQCHERTKVTNDCKSCHR